jgi:hypothetical protein
VVGISLLSYQFFAYVGSVSPFDFIDEGQINRVGSWALEQMSVARR